MPAVVAARGALVEAAASGRSRSDERLTVTGSCPAGGPYRPYERPITSSMTSSVPAPMRFRRMSRQARSMPYSFM